MGTSRLLAHAAEVQPAAIDLHAAVLAAVGLLASVIVAYVVYRLLAGLSINSKKPFSLAAELTIARAMLLIVVAGIFGGSIDNWWHKAVGRDTLWEAPHFVIYAAALAIILLGLWAWYRSGTARWRLISITMLIVPISAPFDNFWHTLFGVEDLSRPIALAWAPPHLALVLAIVAALILLIPVLEREPRPAVRRVFSDIALGAMLSLVYFVLWPVHPTEGFGQLLGFWGAGLFAFTGTGVLLVSQLRHGGVIDATRVSIINTLLFLGAYGKETASDIIINAHDRAPNWIVIVALILPAVFLDITKGKMATWLRAGIAGTLWAFFMFYVAEHFFAPEFQYGWDKAAIALAISFLGGALAPLVARRFAKA